MQNKPNLLDAQMNVTSFYTVDYENDNTFRLPENKANQSQYKANTNPISEKPKMNENLFATKVYENITTFRLEQNKPNQTQSNPISKEIAHFAQGRLAEVLTAYCCFSNNSGWSGITSSIYLLLN